MLKRVSTTAIVILTLAFIASLWSSFPTTTLAQEKRHDGSPAENRPDAVFTNPAPITILDQSIANPYPSTITVSGFTGNIPSTPGSVKVTLNGFSHNFPDDVAMVLVGPTGAALLLQDGAGDDPNMANVTYTLSDTGATRLPDTTAWAAGTYKPTSYYAAGTAFPAPGPGTAHAHPGPASGGTATFSSVFGGTNPNGDWKLFVGDFAEFDAGNISGGWTLEILPPVALPSNDAKLDMDADGKTDYVVVRNVGGGASGQARWFTFFHNGGILATDWGIASDQFFSDDYDGDFKDDFAVFRPGAQGVFYIIRSATNTIYVDGFGQTGDDATVVGDYTGDGLADLAVYRSGAAAGEQSVWYYRSLGSQGFTGVPWGINGDFPVPGDYDGDGRHDFVVQRAQGAQGLFWKRLATGATSNEIFGQSTDTTVPGDYDDDGKTDIAVIRDEGGTLVWEFEPSGTAGTTVVRDSWGVAATDIAVPGDYDGDGDTEYAVWRPGSPSVFYIMTVGTRVITSVNWGEANDIPVANFDSH